MLLERSRVVWIWPQRNINKCESLSLLPSCHSAALHAMHAGHNTGSLGRALWPPFFHPSLQLSWAVAFTLLRLSLFIVFFLSLRTGVHSFSLSHGSSIPNFGASFSTPVITQHFSIPPSVVFFELVFGGEKNRVAQRCVPGVSSAGGAHIIFVE